MAAGNNTHRKTSSATDSATDSTQRQSNPSGYTTSAGERAAGKARERLITRDVALIMAATFFYMTSSMMGTPIIAGFSQSLGASGAVMGFLAGALSLSALICRPIAGNLSDRTSKRKLAVIGALIFLASNLGYYFVPNTAWLLAARILNGVGFACISVCLSTWLSMLLPISRMGAGMGLYGTMNALAQAVGPDLGIRASKAIGYRNTFLIAVGLTCCIVICVLLIKDGGKPPRARLGRQQGGERHHIRLDALFEPRVIPIALIFMLFAIPYFANQSFIVDYANARHAHVIVSLFFPCYAITLLISRIVLRNWFDTKSFLFFMVTGTICQIVMLASLTVMRNNWFVVLAGLATVGAYGMMSSVTQARAVLIAGKARSGMANTTYYAGIDLGMFLGPLIGGFLYGGLPIIWFYPALLLTMPVAWTVYAFAHRTIQASERASRA
ncbi:Multidrug transport protein [Bifidobacterium animalis subsp. animalis IM386]|uniref:Multidrug transport protein n=1 Tax=Bifidobacterium animalis subsp. animalis IM386 TaxID=1402194 RepID=A0AAV2W0N1_9BIFI|nr:MFS transporter [Bifidobacterium animalis]AFI62240.1 multidrug transport protein [Bifidobacterium animalis subsp. animalis ATCC 25527]ANU43342.1 MFS transporter [Bifidobacterium animalis subsp. animalis]AYN22887.1 multidrug transport protein [Bifidobacterium animalis subsp. animalis]KFI42033.1 multidrug transport protein [Bifidobacterium animalis subsp. animalis]PHQ53946.1 MFS transporter [Bifidobacterium animalis subsp. animalis]